MKKKLLILTLLSLIIISLITSYYFLYKKNNPNENNNLTGIYYNPELKINFKYPEGWEIKEEPQCKAYPSDKSQFCLRIVKNNYILTINQTTDSTFKSDPIEIYNSDLENYKKVENDKYTFLVPLFTEQSEEEYFMNILKINSSQSNPILADFVFEQSDGKLLSIEIFPPNTNILNVEEINEIFLILENLNIN